MDGVQVLEGVWFRASEKRLRPFSMHAYEDVGRLTIWPGMARFHGSRGIVWIENVRSIRLGRQGIDLVNPWVVLSHGNGRTAFLADGRGLGWRGPCGGTRRLFEALEHLARPRPAVEIPEVNVAGPST